MKRELAGRRIIITGASSGIGRALAEHAALAGARLVLTARSADKLEELGKSLIARQVEVVTVPADVTVETDRQRILQITRDRFRGLDVLVNNAGIASWEHFANSSEDILRKIMEVNFFAPAELMRAAVPLLKEGVQPAIVNVASRCGRRGLPAWTEYSASKFALCGLTEALRAEFARFDIDVLLIVPGLTQTDFDKHLLRNEGRMNIAFEKGMPVEKVADAILDALRKNRSETVIGSQTRLMLLANRFFPRLVDSLMARKVRQLYRPS